MIISDKVRETSDLTEKDTCNVNQPETAEEFTFWGTEEKKQNKKTKNKKQKQNIRATALLLQ
jgi:hypothetical protein